MIRNNRFLHFVIVAQVSLLSTHAQQEPSPGIGVEHHDNISTGQERSLYVLLQKYSSAGYYVSPNVPSNKLNTASQSCEVPAGEEIYALVDATVSGKAKNCLLIGSSGIYVHNGWEGNSPGRYFIPYDLLIDMPVERKGAFEISIGSVCFDMSGSSVRKDYMITILQDIKREFGAGSDSKDTE